MYTLPSCTSNDVDISSTLNEGLKKMALRHCCIQWLLAWMPSLMRDFLWALSVGPYLLVRDLRYGPFFLAVVCNGLPIGLKSKLVPMPGEHRICFGNRETYSGTEPTSRDVSLLARTLLKLRQTIQVPEGLACLPLGRATGSK